MKARDRVPRLPSWLSGLRERASYLAGLPSTNSLALRSVLGIYLLFLSVYLVTASGHLWSTDEVAVYLSTKSLVEKQSLAIKHINDTFVGPDGDAYSTFGLGRSILSVPLYLVGRLVDGVASPPRESTSAG